MGQAHTLCISLGMLVFQTLTRTAQQAQLKVFSGVCHLKLQITPCPSTDQFRRLKNHTIRESQRWPPFWYQLFCSQFKKRCYMERLGEDSWVNACCTSRVQTPSTHVKCQAWRHALGIPVLDKQRQSGPRACWPARLATQWAPGPMKDPVSNTENHRGRHST